MAFHRYKLPFAGLAALILSLGPADAANLAEQGFFAPLREKAPQSMKLKMPSSYSCSGPISQVTDVADENWRSTSAVFGTTPGGGEGKQYDPKPLLTTKIKAGNGTCLNGHLSAIVGNGKIYGVSRLAMFQVTLTPANGSPRHMVGHYETPYGIASPAVALEAENDVDMLGANFFQRFGTGPHELPAGTYRVDVWWAGAPPYQQVNGGAAGAAFVLKLYSR